MGDQSMRDYGPAAPHGPNMSGQHVATADLSNMSKNEDDVFKSLLLPDDSYDENGTYWADMKFGQKINFIRKVDNAEAKKELRSIGRMIKADPLSPVSFYFRNMVIPGAGLLLEGWASSPFSCTYQSLTCRQLRPLLHRKRQASLPISLQILLEDVRRLQRDLGAGSRLHGDRRHHLRPDLGRYPW